MWVTAVWSQSNEHHRDTTTSDTTLVAVLAIALLIALVTGCGATQTSDKNVVFLTAIEADEVVHQKKKGILRGVQTVAWVDPRDATTFASEHIPGAVNVPFRRVSEEYEGLTSFDVVIVYGSTYDDPVAIGMSKRLIELGIGDVRTLKGGLRAWRDAGFEVESKTRQTNADTNL